MTCESELVPPQQRIAEQLMLFFCFASLLLLRFKQRYDHLILKLSQWQYHGGGGGDSASTPALIRCIEAVNYSKCHSTHNGLRLKPWTYQFCLLLVQPHGKQIEELHRLSPLRGIYFIHLLSVLPKASPEVMGQSSHTCRTV